MENHTNPETRLRAALVTRYSAHLARLNLNDLIEIASDLLFEAGKPTNHNPVSTTSPPLAHTSAPTSVRAPAPTRPTDRPVAGDVWRRKSNGTVVTIKRVDDSRFSLDKQIKWPTGTLSRQRFPLTDYADFVKAFTLVKAGEAN